MDEQRATGSGTPTGSPSKKNFPRLSAELVEEVERLLARRTRNIRLSPELSQLFRERIWPQTAKIVQSWMLWVVVLDVLTLALNALLLPTRTVVSMLLPASMMIPAALLTSFAFVRRPGVWAQGAIILSGVFVILLCVALVGVSAGQEFYERHLTIMLFVAVTAIIIFPVPLKWTMAIAIFALGLYLVFQLRNPSIGVGSALAGTLFFACGVFATVVARRTIIVLAHKTFLLELRDRSRLAVLTDANVKLERLATTDPLTGVANRRSMNETLERLWSNNHGTGRRLAMLMCDVDEFKKLNDSLGHAEGDRCLVKVAGIIQSCLRDEGDLVARYGGEEFLIALPDADEEVAKTIAETIRDRVEAASLPNPTSQVTSYVTVSVGIAVSPLPSTNITTELLQRSADMALYNAKKAGRNRVMVYSRGAGP